MGAQCSSTTAALVSNGDKCATKLQNGHGLPKMKVDETKDSLKDGHLLTNKQLKHVKKTWKLLDDDLASRGSKVFLEIFVLAPHTKTLFHFRDIPDNELMTNHLFKAHAGRFMQVVSSVIQNINDLETQLSPTLHNLGKAHVVKYGVSMDYFDLFKTAMLNVWERDLGSSFTPQARQAWSIVFDYVLNEMKVGYISANQNHVKTLSIVMTTESKDTQSEQLTHKPLDSDGGS